ncbi:MAG TPA: hypothetical protein VGD45_02505 [Steroidobacter sp.]|uniref:hypothetical protein n=1 Tax=Steroidobacter sp. TaxID=1978227 RepID=UPI002ED80A14
MISLGEIYDKDINFLLGSGASFGVLPTLKLGLRTENGQRWTLEELATQFENAKDQRYIPLFMHYYVSCIRPAQLLDVGSVTDEVGKNVLANYRMFLETVLSMLQRRPALDRRCNLFTTNYDGCIPLVADDLLRRGSYDFVLNDGTRGFRRKLLEARNFNSFLCQTGVFDRHKSSVPQINLIHLHGSVYWSKAEDGIEVNYSINTGNDLLDGAAREKLAAFSAGLMNAEFNLAQLVQPEFEPEELDAFWEKYEIIPVVNPTKWKFHETVYEEHYYQMLRLLSYELEKPNAVLITFGFSFADEHILNLVKRSLSNPHLQVFICCYGKSTHEILSAQFRQYSNVKCITLDNDEQLDFSAFNSKIFTGRTEKTVEAMAPANIQGQPAVIPLVAAVPANENVA